MSDAVILGLIGLALVLIAFNGLILLILHYATVDRRRRNRVPDEIKAQADLGYYRNPWWR